VLCIASAESSDSSLAAAVSRAINADIVVVAGAGNRPKDSDVGFPAAYPGVIAVAGIDRNGEHADVSVTGPEIVLAAPAVDIMTTYLRDSTHSGYITGDGTSAATAIIAGAAALVRSKYPDLSAAEVVHRLTATADDKGPPGRDHEYGYGVVNLVKALTADVPPLQPTVTSSSPNATAAASPSVGGTTGGSRSALLIGLAVIGILIALGGYLVWRRQAHR
jgi:subtilisin family serine protease